jgi:large subunit ribosomal protein L24
MALHVKKGDTVQIIAGDHKGQTGKVLTFTRQNMVVVGRNLVRNTVLRRNPQGAISIEQPIHISKVLPLSPKSSKGTRVRYSQGPDGSKKRVTVDGAEIGTVKKAK